MLLKFSVSSIGHRPALGKTQAASAVKSTALGGIKQAAKLTKHPQTCAGSQNRSLQMSKLTTQERDDWESWHNDLLIKLGYPPQIVHALSRDLKKWLDTWK